MRMVHDLTLPLAMLPNSNGSLQGVSQNDEKMLICGKESDWAVLIG